jgi:hypothetical protein
MAQKSQTRNDLVSVHHPDLAVQKTVRRHKAEVLALSGWKPGELPKSKAETPKE